MKRLWHYLRSDLKLRDVLVAIAAVILALGFTFTTPRSQIRQLRAADSALDRRVTANEKEIAGLREQQRFTNYMLCVNARRTDPASAPPDCIPLIDARKPR